MISVYLLLDSACDHAGARTQDPILKRDVLYLLSYVVNAYCYPQKSLQRYSNFAYSQK